MEYTSNTLQVNFNILQHTSVYFKYTSSILQPFELDKKKYTSSLSYFDKSSKSIADFVKLDYKFDVNLKYTSSILSVYFKCTS